MIRITTFAGRKVAVFGLGMSGIASAKALIAGGAEVAAWDDGRSGRAAAEAAGVALTDLSGADWSAYAALVLAPGVPLTDPEPHWTVAHAAAAGIEVIGDTELFFRERAKIAPGAPVIGITGTNGKSTTTALVVHILRHAGVPVSMGGNIGQAVLSLVPFDEHQTYVIELSSYQLDLTPGVRCTAAALLNLSPDHLDRHGSMARYGAVKAGIFANMGSGDVAVVSLDDAFCSAIADTVTGRMRLEPISVARALDCGLWVDGDGRLMENRRGGQVVLAPLSGIETLNGAHNRQNAAAAFALARGVGVGAEEIVAGLSTFPGLAHRMEIVGRRAGVLFVNDSKGTNADAAAKALASFENIHWIAGGLAKDGGIKDLAPLFPRIAKAYLIGAAAAAFAATLNGKVPHAICGTLEAAVAAAAEDARASTGSEPVVLLSPACASFDQYRSFAVRGDAFRDLVKALPGMALNPRGDL